MMFSPSVSKVRWPLPFGQHQVIEYNVSGGSVKPRNSICNLQLSKGNCQATLRRFYYDPVEGICKLFVFGGCQGNANNFETMSECINSCIGTEIRLPKPSSSQIEQTTSKPKNQLASKYQYNIMSWLGLNICLTLQLCHLKGQMFVQCPSILVHA